ncbi:unnamed protein product [Scytosiphon promiscuus]
MENRLFLMDKNVFSAEYLNWVCDLTALVPPPQRNKAHRRRPSHHDDSSSGDDDVDEVELSAAKVALFLALDTVARAKDKERLSQLMRYARGWFRASPAVCRWALEQASRGLMMTTNNYWQYTMLLQCSLQVVRFEFSHLCLDLIRFYAPLERHLYYEQDPAIGEHFYLSAVKQQQQRRRRQREKADAGERGRRRRAEGAGGEEEDVTGPAAAGDETVPGRMGAGSSMDMIEAIRESGQALGLNLTSAEVPASVRIDCQSRKGFVVEIAGQTTNMERFVMLASDSVSSVNCTDGTGGGSDLVASDDAEFGDHDRDEDWPPQPSPSPTASPCAAASSGSPYMGEDPSHGLSAADDDDDHDGDGGAIDSHGDDDDDDDDDRRVRSVESGRHRRRRHRRSVTGGEVSEEGDKGGSDGGTGVLTSSSSSLALAERAATAAATAADPMDVQTCEEVDQVESNSAKRLRVAGSSGVVSPARGDGSGGGAGVGGGDGKSGAPSSAASDVSGVAPGDDATAPPSPEVARTRASSAVGPLRLACQETSARDEEGERDVAGPGTAKRLARGGSGGGRTPPSSGPVGGSFSDQSPSSSLSSASGAPPPPPPPSPRASSEATEGGEGRRVQQARGDAGGVLPPSPPVGRGRRGRRRGRGSGAACGVGGCCGVGAEGAGAATGEGELGGGAGSAGAGQQGGGPERCACCGGGGDGDGGGGDDELEEEEEDVEEEEEEEEEDNDRIYEVFLRAEQAKMRMSYAGMMVLTRLEKQATVRDHRQQQDQQEVTGVLPSIPAPSAGVASASASAAAAGAAVGEQQNGSESRQQETHEGTGSGMIEKGTSDEVPPTLETREVTAAAETRGGNKRRLSALGLPQGSVRETAAVKRRIEEEGAASSMSEDGEQEQVRMPPGPKMERVLREEYPGRLRWWNSVALVPRFIGTFLDLLHELHASSDRSTFRSRGGRGCDSRRPAVSVVTRRKQSEHLFVLLLEIGRISPAETRLLLRTGTIPRVLHSILGGLHDGPIPPELLQRCGDEHPGGWGDASNEDVNLHAADPPTRAWISGNGAFAPCLRLLVELVCSCAMAGDRPSPLLFPGLPESVVSGAIDSGSETSPVTTPTKTATSPAAAALSGTGNSGGSGSGIGGVARHTAQVVSVPFEVLDACWPDTMDEGLRGKHGEEVVVLPNDADARLLTDTLCLEMLFLGRPKGVQLPVPQAHLQAEHLRCLLRLSRHLCWNNDVTTRAVLAECGRGLNEGQVVNFLMHLRVLVGLVGVVDGHTHLRVRQVVLTVIRAAEMNLNFTKECLEILSALAKALLGASPELVPPELLPALRGAILSHASTLVTNFILNSKLHGESRQTAALCLLLGVPEVWVLNGSRIPTTGPLRGHGSAAFASASRWGSGGGVERVGGAGGGPKDDAEREDLLRKQAEVAAETQAVAAAFADNMSTGSSDEVQVVGVVPARRPAEGTVKSDNRGGGLQAEGRIYGPQQQQRRQQQQQQQQQGERRGDPAGGGATDARVDGAQHREARQHPHQQQQQQQRQRQQHRQERQQRREEQEGRLSETSIQNAVLLLRRLMSQIPSVVDCIERERGRAQQLQYVELVQSMVQLLTGSEIEKKELARVLPQYMECLFRLDRVRRQDDLTKGAMLEFACHAMERHPDLYQCLEDENVAAGLAVFFIHWHDNKASIEYNATYASMYYELLLKGCQLYPSFLETVKRSSSLVWCLEWFLLRGYAPTFRMATTLMSIFTLCLRKYGSEFASLGVNWVFGPHAKEVYLKVADGPNPQLPLYALWMLEACIRPPDGDMDTFISCGGLDQVTLLLAHVMNMERSPRQQTSFSRSQNAAQENRRKVTVLCERVFLNVHAWLNDGYSRLRQLETSQAPPSEHARALAVKYVNCQFRVAVESIRGVDASLPRLHEGGNKDALAKSAATLLATFAFALGLELPCCPAWCAFLWRNVSLDSASAEYHLHPDLESLEVAVEEVQARMVVFVALVAVIASGAPSRGAAAGAVASEDQRGHQSGSSWHRDEPGRCKKLEITYKFDEGGGEGFYSEHILFFREETKEKGNASGDSYHCFVGASTSLDSCSGFVFRFPQFISFTFPAWTPTLCCPFLIYTHRSENGRSRTAVSVLPKVISPDCWFSRAGARVIVNDLLFGLVTNNISCATIVCESIVHETVIRTARMTQIHKHRQSDLNRREGGGGAAGTATAGAGVGGGKAKGNRNGHIESNLSFIRGLSAKMIPVLTRHYNECQEQAYQYFTAADELSSDPPAALVAASAALEAAAKARKAAKAKARAAATASVPAAEASGGQASATVGGGSGSGGGPGKDEGHVDDRDEDADDEEDAARREVEEMEREEWEEEVRQHRETGQQAQDMAEHSAMAVSNLLYYMVFGSASCGVKSANAVARYITRRVVISRDPHALQLLNAPFVSSLFVAIMDNCAPITGITRYDYASEDGGADWDGDCDTDDLVELVALLAPEAIKTLDDNQLNVYLSNLCTSLTDVADDVIKKLAACRDASGADNSGSVSGVRGGGCDSMEEEDGDKGRQLVEHSVHNAIRTVKEICLWLSLFFRVREDTKEACQASCFGVLSDLARAAEAQPDSRILAQVRDSIQLL